MSSRDENGNTQLMNELSILLNMIKWMYNLQSADYCV